MSSQDQIEQDDTETFLISVLIDVLKKQKINVEGIFAFDTRTVFIHCVFVQSGLDLLLYIPSKYEIRTEKNLGIPIFNLSSDENDDVEDKPPADSLFISTTNVNIERLKLTRQKGLNRFIPIFSSSKYKIAYVDNYFLTFINRHNSIDGFMMSSPCGLKGYYLTIDLQNFYIIGPKIVDDINVQLDMMSKAVFNKLDSEITKSKDHIKRATDMLDKINPKQTLDQHNTRTKKLIPLLNDGAKSEKAITLMRRIRAEMFKSMFEIENIAYVLSELPE